MGSQSPCPSLNIIVMTDLTFSSVIVPHIFTKINYYFQGLWSETKDGMAQLVRDDNGDTYAVKEDDVQDVNPPKYYQCEE